MGVLAWHEIRAMAVTDPRTGQRLLVVVQKNVTAKVETERHIAQVAEAEHRLLEQVFPRHVLSYMIEQSCKEQQQQLQKPPAASTPAFRRGSAMTVAAPWRPQVRDCTHLATWHRRVTVLFADIQGFTPMCGQLPAAVVMRFLNDLFVRFDAQLDSHEVYKVETIGDCYVVAGGLVHEDADGMAAVRRASGEEDAQQGARVFAFAQAMLRSASAVTLPTTGEPVRLRVGIHTGPVVSGVVGTRMPRFCLFGDTMNTGGVEIKGKGTMSTHLWTPPKPGMDASRSSSRNIGGC
ncbi:Guanylate cyclase soluble subunit beta-2 [Tetrabaena socialis]|uniref:Guanylate cyclase soluble subunit beta-2 n=1 Tax=Tetrabaena socialis TaxID=47790 RepID=A0A2J7ZR90_9CHLO|nr:Guanylate cyclase soluble subunit beta-2 [Tetrabaena socialis]|eukprot:PNH02766.1 Guanylate cyclase soluble subunit beta-2 [Tetrabaena socialis]